MWWADLAGWPNGASEAATANCVDRAFGRNNGPGDATRTERKPNDPVCQAATVLAVIAVAFIIYKQVK